MENIYISYANQDFNIAKEAKAMLESSSLAVKFVDHTEMNLSGDVASEMLDGIKKASVFLCLFSKHSNTSNFMSIEINAAVKREKDIYIINVDRSEMGKKTNFALANSTLLKGDKEKALKEFIKVMQGGGKNE